MPQFLEKYTHARHGPANSWGESMTTDNNRSPLEESRIWRPPPTPGALEADREADPARIDRGEPPPRSTRRGFRLPIGLAAVGIFAAALVGGFVGGFAALRLDGSSSSSAETGSNGGAATVAVDITTAVSDAVRKARPAVVRIESASRRSLDVGSGVVISPQGYILTNAHVVMGTDDLKVVFMDGTELPAVLIGHDYPFNDIAVLQVAPVGLSVMEVGDSSRLEPGEMVVAIGNPLGELYGSVTMGVVSGVNRSRILDGMRHDDIIQTDAAVNNGNSGGALISLAGELVGLPTTILRQTSGGQAVEGIAFAIPSNRAMAVAEAIIAARGPIPRPTLELEHIDLNEEVAARLPALTTKSGAVVLGIRQGGAAAEAGVRAGDVIIQLGNTPVDGQTPLLNALAMHQPGEVVKVVLNRNGRIIETEVRLAQR